jgi:hypothetical protein
MTAGELFARISNLYGRHQLCPPVRLRDLVASWFAAGIAPAHVIACVERHLKDHAASCQSGAGDRLLSHLNDVVRHTWKDRGATGPQRVGKRPTAGNAVSDWDQYTGRTKRLSDDTDGDFGGM